MNNAPKRDIVDKSFAEIAVGDTASFFHHISEEDIVIFSRLSGDENPLHIDEKYAQQTKFGGRVVHGLFLAALVSRLIGVYLPGRRSLLLFTEFRFKVPARIGDLVKVEGVVIAKSPAINVVEMAVEIKKNSVNPPTLTAGRYIMRQDDTICNLATETAGHSKGGRVNLVEGAVKVQVL